jgi:dephospho-CoA kinase
MIKVGITGGIGSGKSLVCEIFLRLGISIYNADTRAKWLMNSDEKIKQILISKWGQQIYKNNQLDRSMLAGIIFDNKEAIDLVNSIVHPAVGIDFKNWCKEHTNEIYIIKEAALLFESNADKDLDTMVTVYSKKNIRIERVIKRDKITREQVISRINNQLPDEEKVKRSEFVIVNNEEQSVLMQVLNLHNTIITRFL